MAPSEESNIQIDESHDQTPPPPVPTSHAVPSPDSNSSIDLKGCAMRDEWSVEVENFVRNNPDSLRSPLNERGDTALHIAVDAWSTTFVKELVKFVRPEDQLIHNNDGNIPLHLAVSTGQREMTKLLLSDQTKLFLSDQTKLFFSGESEDWKLGGIFFAAINTDMYDVAMELYKIYSPWLTTTIILVREEKYITQALQRLGKKRLSRTSLDRTSLEMTLDGNYMDLFMKLWNQAAVNFGRDFGRDAWWLSNELWEVLTNLLKSRNILIMTWLLAEHRALVMKIKDSRCEKNVLHLFVEYRWPWPFLDTFLDTFLECKHADGKFLLRKVDCNGNNILHLAAHLEPSSPSGLRAYNQLERDLRYFKRVRGRLPLELTRMENNDGKKPIEIFYDEHKKLSDEIKGSAKGIAESGMLVAALVATVVFAAALTVPGNKNNAWFIVFFLTNAIALFTSCASILSFLSNFTTSRFAESEFVITLHPSLTLGPVLLIISVAVMVVAFTAASFLIFDHTSKWVSYLVISMGVFPLLLFLFFQFNLFDDLILSKYYRLTRFYRLAKEDISEYLLEDISEYLH